VQALPMRLRNDVVGALNLFRAEPGPFDPVGTPIAQAWPTSPPSASSSSAPPCAAASSTSNCRPL
jgi:hypothetical protein